MLKKIIAVAGATGNYLFARFKRKQRTLFEAGCAIAASNGPQDIAFTRELARKPLGGPHRRCVHHRRCAGPH